MKLYLRRVTHSQARDNYSVIQKREEGKFEIGSIDIQRVVTWTWEIYTAIPVRSFETRRRP
jgi:hypothetical protein